MRATHLLMHACMHGCVYVCTHMHVCLHVCSHACMHWCACTCVHSCTSMHAQALVSAYVHTRTLASVCGCAGAHACARVCIHCERICTTLWAAVLSMFRSSELQTAVTVPCPPTNIAIKADIPAQTNVLVSWEQSCGHSLCRSAVYEVQACIINTEDWFSVHMVPCKEAQLEYDDGLWAEWLFGRRWMAVGLCCIV